jgi:predicted DNA-binding antitoxin AbrB/MazE fold protein
LAGSSNVPDGDGEGNTMVKTVKARFTKGAIVPLEPLDIEEGEEILVTLEDQVHDSTEAEDAALARAIAEGLETESVSIQSVVEALRGDRDET